MRFLGLLLAASSALCALGQTTTSQKPPTPPPPAPPALLAPDPVVHADRTVTFTFTNATAHQVSLALEGVAQPIPMVQGTAGRVDAND